MGSFYKDKVAVLTGGANGMGKEIWRCLLEEGAKVVVCDIEGDTLETVAQEFKGMGDFITVVADVSNQAQIQAMVDKAVEAYGTIDVLFANAGILFFEEFLKMPVESLQNQFDVNAKGVFLTCQAVAKVMAEQNVKGSIMVNASFQSEWCNTKSTAYAASKGAVKQLTKTMAVDLAPYGIRVNCVGPGYIITRLTDVTRTTPGREEKLLAKVSLGRGGSANEIARSMMALASDDFTYMTGAFIPIDGGWSCL